MNYEDLPDTYWAAQRERIEDLRSRISAREAIGVGRVVPDDDALAIGDGKRLAMAVMFIDICVFSSRPMEKLEHQDLTLRWLNLFFTEMIRIAEEYGGNVEKNTGDGLLVYFSDGEGTPPEHGPKRAVSCALTMLATTKHLINPIVQSSGAPAIDLRISIDYGMVTVARIGAPRRFNANVAIGATVNFASKMLRFAKPNEIVIGATARTHLPAAWQTNWTVLVPESTGWTYVHSGAPYGLYRYTGRWKNYM